MTDADKVAQAWKEQIEKLSQTFKLPEVDVPALIEKQRKTIDAISKAAQLSNEAAMEVSHRQLEILRSTSEQVAAMVREMKLSGEQQRELAAKSFEAALTSAREGGPTNDRRDELRRQQIRAAFFGNMAEVVAAYLKEACRAP